jgi:hypothetical protein
MYISLLCMWVPITRLFFLQSLLMINTMSSPWYWKTIWVVGFIKCYCFGYGYWAKPIKQRRDAVTIFCGCYVICVLHNLFLTLKYKVFLIFSWWTLYLWTYQKIIKTLHMYTSSLFWTKECSPWNILQYMIFLF